MATFSARDWRGARRRRYDWPASRLTSREMSLLLVARARTGLPITELLRRAVQVAYEGEGSHAS